MCAHSAGSAIVNCEGEAHRAGRFFLQAPDRRHANIQRTLSDRTRVDIWRDDSIRAEEFDASSSRGQEVNTAVPDNSRPIIASDGAPHGRLDFCRRIGHSLHLVETADPNNSIAVHRLYSTKIVSSEPHSNLPLAVSIRRALAARKATHPPEAIAARRSQTTSRCAKRCRVVQSLLRPRQHGSIS